MDLEFSDDEAELRENVRSVLAGICPPSVVRTVYEQKADAAAIWETMIELDWPAIAVDEAHGGLGLGFVELAIVAEGLGWATVPSPFLATVTQFAPAVAELGGEAHRADLLGRVAAGEVTGALALAEQGRWDLAAVRATASSSSGGWRLAGTKEAVLDGATADEVVVIARGSAGLCAFLVERSQLSPRPREVIDPTLPMADLVLDGIEVGPERVLAAPGATVAPRLARAVEAATVALATATVGTCRGILEATVAYAKAREQYGKPIGSFQALKHRMADMYLSVERATSLCWFAALTIAEDDPRRAEAAHLAKAAVGECQRLVVGEGLQLHGGVGYTWEHDLHFLLKRAKAGDALFGNATSHRSALATMLGLAPALEEGGA
ncbi:MAG: Acyl-CoA dehydrogenase [Actinomycetia bacterium]|nr:Acyl-CoA dehydrogenase [Actinomycetes bacterium]